MLQQLLAIISRVLPLNPLAGKEHLLEKLNPDRFYLENVRALLGVSDGTAQILIDTAVRQGAFSRHIGVLCPDKNIGASAQREIDLPEYVRCVIERDGEYEEVELPSAELDRITYYSLNDEEASSVLGSPA